MRSGHKQTLARIFATPTTPDLRWAEVVALLTYLGASMDARRGGSHRRVVLHGRRFHIAEPHGAKPLPRATVRALRDFLSSIGVEP